MRMIVLSALAAAALAMAAGPALAQEGSFAGDAPQTEVLVGDTQDTYGTGSLTVFSVPAVNFTPRASTTAYSAGGGIDRFLPAGGVMDAAPALPNGSQIERIELRACDSNAAASVTLNFGTCPTGGSSCNLAGTVTTGATPGCNDFSTTLATPIIVNNRTTPLLLEVGTGTTTATTFSAVKLYYRLRVSPAPAVATFPNDVPTSHIFFRYIEALAASGITGGCAAGSYCPDSAVTRGQMAAFMALALGLHFPN